MRDRSLIFLSALLDTLLLKIFDQRTNQISLFIQDVIYLQVFEWERVSICVDMIVLFYSIYSICGDLCICDGKYVFHQLSANYKLLINLEI